MGTPNPGGRGTPWRRSNVTAARPYAPRFGRRPRDDEGFGLIEAVVGFTVLTIALVPIGVLLSNLLQQSATVRQHITALGVAERWVEILGNEGPPVNVSTSQPEVGNAISEPSSTLSSSTYTVSAEFNWDTTSGQSADPCVSGTVPILDLLVTVKWNTTTAGAGTVTTRPRSTSHPRASSPTGSWPCRSTGSHRGIRARMSTG